MIYEKLLKIQKDGIALERDGVNPHFQSSYTTLNEVLKKIKKPLNDAGILILQTPEREGLRTILIDTTVEMRGGQEIDPRSDYSRVECFMPYVETTTAQKLGSNNTYNRRYSLITLLGLEDEDDDAEVASKPQAVKKAGYDGIGQPKSVLEAKEPPFGETLASGSTASDFSDIKWD